MSLFQKDSCMALSIITFWLKYPSQCNYIVSWLEKSLEAYMWRFDEYALECCLPFLLASFYHGILGKNYVSENSKIKVGHKPTVKGRCCLLSSFFAIAVVQP